MTSGRRTAAPPAVTRPDATGSGVSVTSRPGTSAVVTVTGSDAARVARSFQYSTTWSGLSNANR